MDRFKRIFYSVISAVMGFGFFLFDLPARANTPSIDVIDIVDPVIGKGGGKNCQEVCRKER